MLRSVLPLLVLVLAVPAGALAVADCPRGSLGIAFTKVQPALAAQLGLEDGQGALVTRVYEERTGARAGLMRFDVITHLDGKPVRAADLERTIRGLKVGSRVRVRVLRRLEPKELVVEVERYRRPPRPRRSGCAQEPRREIVQTRIVPADPGMVAAVTLARAAKMGARERELLGDARKLEKQVSRLEKKLGGVDDDLARMEKKLAKQRRRIEEELRELEARRASLREKLLGRKGELQRQVLRLRSRLEGLHEERNRLREERKKLEEASVPVLEKSRTRDGRRIII